MHNPREQLSHSSCTTDNQIHGKPLHAQGQEEMPCNPTPTFNEIATNRAKRKTIPVSRCSLMP
jgi:hypothetical protein